MPRKPKNVILIGGSDPSGGAGLPADLRALERLKVPAFPVSTAVTAQNERRFLSFEVVSSRNFADQLKSLLPKARGSVIKIGMLGDGRLIAPLISFLRAAKPFFVVLDPVFRSTTGRNLLNEEGIRLLKTRLLPFARLVTPNLREAEVLSGLPCRNEKEMKRAGIFLREKTGAAFFIKGGHLRGRPLDLLFDGRSVHTFRQRRVPGKEVHGTGCTLAASIAGHLARGKKLKEAIRGGRREVLRKLRKSRQL